MKSEIPEFNEKDALMIETILNVDNDKISYEFKLFSEELKANVFLATIFYDEKRKLDRKEADEFNDIAWDKMERGDYEGALIDAKKSIDMMSLSNNNDTIALIYYHLKRKDILLLIRIEYKKHITLNIKISFSH